MQQVNLMIDDEGCPLDPNARARLRGLAQRGARLTAEGSGNIVRAERKGKMTIIAWLDRSVITALDAAGWLTEIEAGTFILAPKGRAIARIMKAAPAPSASIAGSNVPVPELPTGPIADRESPLAWARQHRNREGKPYLSQEAFDAGERLRQDFHQSGLMPRTTFDWDAISRSKDEQRGAHGLSGTISNGASSAAERVRKAIAALPPELAGLVYDVCCFELGVEETGRRHGMPQRAGHYMLSIALNALARHYGLLPRPSGSFDPARRARHWGAPGYKPAMDGNPGSMG